MKIKYTITGLDCPNCAAKLASQIQAEEGIESAKINFLTEKLTVETALPEDETFAVVTRLATAFEDGIEVER